LIKKAFEPFTPPELTQFDEFGCGIDWGDDHDTTFLVIGLLEDTVYQLYNKRYQHPTPDQLTSEMIHIENDFPGVKFVWETSPIGSFVRNAMIKYYPEFTYINSTFSHRKIQYIDNVYIWLTDEDLHLFDARFKSQLKGFKNDKKNDDYHDAFAHVLYHITTPRTAMKQTISVIYHDDPQAEYD